MDFMTCKKQIIDEFKIVEKELPKHEFINAYLKVQNIPVTRVMNELHADSANLRIFDVLNHFKSLNEERGNIIGEDLKTFEPLCAELNNCICAELSGNAGEAKAFKSLDTLTCENRILKNVELMTGDHHVEIDAVVLTRKAQFIIEVKNPKKNIRIDERGNYIRLSNHEHLECNIGEKMNEREYMLRKTLNDAGVKDTNIESIVVFTNSTIEVENLFSEIQHAFLSQLPHIIKKYKGEFKYDDNMLDTIEEVINSAQCDNVHRLPFDIDGFVDVFSTIVAKLETCESEDTSSLTEEEPEEDKEKNIMHNRGINLENVKKYAKKFAPVAAAFVAVNAIDIIVDKLMKK